MEFYRISYNSLIQIDVQCTSIIYQNIGHVKILQINSNTNSDCFPFSG